MKYERVTSDCNLCSLRDGNTVQGQGPKDPKILLLGEAPGAHEALKGEPFVGPSGQLLNYALGTAGILRYRCWVTNVISCRPPNNNFFSEEALSARSCCKPGFREELDFILEKGIKVIIALGKSACMALNIDGSMTTIRGSVYQYKGIPVVATYHPAFINRMKYDKGAKGKMNPMPVWFNDLKKAKEISITNWKPVEEHFNIYPDKADVFNFCEEVESNPDVYVGLDIETTNLDYTKGKIVMIGLASSKEDVLCVPLLSQYGIRYWSEDDEKVVKRRLIEMFQKKTLIVQNVLFDIPYLNYHDYKIPWDKLHDTMIAHHTLAPELPHDLGFIVSQYGQTAYWKEEFKSKETTILGLPDEMVRTYNCRDSAVLEQCLSPMFKDLLKYELMPSYKRTLELLEPIADMEANGVLLDQKALTKWKSKKELEEKILEAKLRKETSLPKDFNLNSDDDMRLLLFGIEANKFKVAQETLNSTKEVKAYLWTCLNCKWKHHHLLKTRPPKCGCLKPKMKRLEEEKLIEVPLLNPTTKKYQELNKLKYILEHVKMIYDLKSYRGRKTKTTKVVAVNKEGRLSFKIALENRLRLVKSFKRDFSKEIKAIEDLLNFLTKYSKYTELRKLITTYSHFKVDLNQRVHTHFLPAGTATGRLSSVGPNLQQMPIRTDPDFRKIFIVPDDSVWIKADYKNLEVHVLALECEDNVLINDLLNKKDIHSENTKVLFEITEDNPIWKLARRAAKIFMFGRVSYGGSRREIFLKVSMEVPELHLTLAQFKNAEEKWFGVHQKIQDYQQKTIAHALSERWVENFRGRKRYLLGDVRDIPKQALNTPIQGSAAEIVNESLILLHKAFKEYKLKSKIILQVHDELDFEVKKTELSLVKKLIKQIMEREIDYRGRKFSFSIDIEIGKSWGDVK